MREQKYNLGVSDYGVSGWVVDLPRQGIKIVNYEFWKMPAIQIVPLYNYLLLKSVKFR